MTNGFSSSSPPAPGGAGPEPPRRQASPVVLLAAGGLALVGMVGGLFLFQGLAADEPWKTLAFSRLAACPKAASMLGGAPQEHHGWLGTGERGHAGTSFDGTGRAEWVYVVEGPRGEAAFHVSARRANGTWQLTNATLAFQGRMLDVVACKAP